jgi:hypothetical protein
MAESAKQAVGNPPSLNVVADAGYSNGEQAEACEQQGIVPHVPGVSRLLCKRPSFVLGMGCRGRGQFPFLPRPISVEV